jgi:hypothetical protein
MVDANQKSLSSKDIDSNLQLKTGEEYQDTGRAINEMFEKYSPQP